MKDYYKILEIQVGADIMTIKKAYRRLAIKYHPDKNKSIEAVQKFIEATEAYEVLRDPINKREYDSLYNMYFKNKTEIVKPQEKEYYDQKQQKWAEYGSEKAKEYSSIPFEEFARRLLKEISVGANYFPNLMAMLFVGGVAISILAFIPDAFNFSVGLGFFLLVTVFGLIYVAFRLFLVAQSDYKEERIRKISNIK